MKSSTDFKQKPDFFLLSFETLFQQNAAEIYVDFSKQKMAVKASKGQIWSGTISKKQMSPEVTLCGKFHTYFIKNITGLVLCHSTMQ